MTYPFTKRQPPIRTEMLLRDVGLFTIEETCKDQAKKILEEAAEVYAALELYTQDVDLGNDCYDSKQGMLEECADVIIAAMNMAYSLGFDVGDIAVSISDCTMRNAKRGRLDPPEDE